jgi:ATP-dependent Lon protease
LGPEDLGPDIDVSAFSFATTADVEPRRSALGQDRALRSIRLGVRMGAPGYNVYVVGLTGSRKEALLKDLVTAQVPDHEPPLVPGQGRQLARDMAQLVETMKRKIPEAFRQETFEQEKEALSEKHEAEIKSLKADFEALAKEKNLHIQPTPQGQLLFIPMRDGKPIEDAAQYEALSDDEKKQINESQEALGKEAREMFKRQKAVMEAMGREVEEIVKVYAGRIVDPLVGAIAEKYENPRVGEYLQAVREHALENLENFKESGPQQPALPFPMPFLQAAEADRFLEYSVNVVVDNSKAGAAPVLTEESPTYRNLFGAIEKVVDQTGKLVTNFTRIKSGKILRASGGYLVFNLEDAITEPLVWKSLKRVLRSGSVEIESYKPLSFLSITGLQPEPIPVNTRIVVFGSRMLFHMLQYWDPDFSEIFKVVADFDYETDRNAEGTMAYAQRIADLTRFEGLPHFDREAVAEVVRFGSRQVGHKEKTSALLDHLDDLVHEAAFFALEDEADLVRSEHVRKALQDRIFRRNRMEEKLRELIQEGTLLVDVEGSKVGQLNGLAVLSMGEYAFGRPSRVSSSLGMGSAGVVNIEREAKLSGATHDKGVLILGGYLRNRYGRNRPLSFTASLAFEQSYSGIDGDSASSTELYALLSRLGELPLRQDIAVTGSVNQLGEVQAIGGANEKIEGFYHVCKTVGLTGRQGVMIPESNVRNLVLDPEVIEAVRGGQFHIYPVRTIDEGMEILTGLPAGEPGREGTINGRVDAALDEFDRRQRERNGGKSEQEEKPEEGEEGEPAGEKSPPKPPEPEPSDA